VRRYNDLFERVGELSSTDRRAKAPGLRGNSMKKWQCIVCGLIYNEAEGWPDDGIAPGTLWQDVPEDWLCPDCGVGKMDFEMIEIG
jgi:rubredoxin